MQAYPMLSSDSTPQKTFVISSDLRALRVILPPPSPKIS